MSALRGLPLLVLLPFVSCSSPDRDADPSRIREAVRRYLDAQFPKARFPFEVKHASIETARPRPYVENHIRTRASLLTLEKGRLSELPKDWDFTFVDVPYVRGGVIVVLDPGTERILGHEGYSRLE